MKIKTEKFHERTDVHFVYTQMECFSVREKVTFPTMLHLVKIYRHLQTNKKNVQIEHINYRIESLNITPIYFLGIILASNVKTSNKKRKKM